MSYRKWIEIDLRSLASNIREIKQHLKNNIVFIAVLKDNAYGFGLNKLCSLVMENGADWIGMVDQYEGKRVRNIIGDNVPIFVMTPPFSEESIKITIDNNLIQGIDSYKQARKLNILARKKNKICQVHLKINTGLNRYGVNIDDLVQLSKKIIKLSNLELEGVYTHFSTQYSDLNNTKYQFERFTKAKNLLLKNNIDIKMYHCANSTVAIDFPNMHMNAVRIGFSLFNFSPGLRKKWKLLDCFRFESKINKIREIPAGEYVGYDKKFKSKKPIKIGIIPVGYADGIPTTISDKSHVLVKGFKIPIIASVCMSQIFIDLSSHVDIKEGEKVTLIGKQGKENIRAKDIAELGCAGEAEMIMRIMNATKDIHYI